MKASRLLTILLLLQTHGRMTSAELAERLEVSRRTILRDIEALSAAGVPVYSERGRHGAIVLMAEARLNAAHLEPEELEALLVAGLDHRVVEALHLEAAASSSAVKLASRRPAHARSRRLADVIVADSSAWASDENRADVAALAQAVLTGCRLRILYRRSGRAHPEEMVIDPYGLAVKAGRWYLVADADMAPRLFALTRLSGYWTMDAIVQYRPGQSLTTAWDALRTSAEPGGDLLVTAHLRADRADLARRVLGTRVMRVSSPFEADGRRVVELVVRYDHPEAVRQLLQFGDHIEVLTPLSARRRIRELATALSRAHTDPCPPVHAGEQHA